MAADTIFSKIIRREIPAKIVYETEDVLAFHDVAPQAPTHVLVIPKKPIENLISATEQDKDILGALMLAVKAIADKLELNSTGYRVVMNNGAAAGQTVFHMHIHILAGRAFSWPPG